MFEQWPKSIDNTLGESQEFKQKLECFFIGGENSQNEVIILNEESPEAVRIKVKIRPSQAESADFPKDFNIEMDGVVTIDDVPEKGAVLSFNDAHFTIGDKKIGIKEICPNYNLKMEMESFNSGSSSRGSCSFEKSNLTIRKFNSPHDFIITSEGICVVPIACVMPPASLLATAVCLILSSKEVLPWST